LVSSCPEITINVFAIFSNQVDIPNPPFKKSLTKSQNGSLIHVMILRAVLDAF
jgi:hypothetical protein